MLLLVNSVMAEKSTENVVVVIRCVALYFEEGKSSRDYRTHSVNSAGYSKFYPAVRKDCSASTF